MKVIYEQSPAVWRICETSVLRVLTCICWDTYCLPCSSQCWFARWQGHFYNWQYRKGWEVSERTSELRLRGVSQLIMFGRLPYTFDRTLTASPVPLRVGLRYGMGASVIKNIGRRWEAKRTLQTFFVWEWCCRRKCRKLKFLHPPEPEKFFSGDKSQLDTTFSRCA